MTQQELNQRIDSYIAQNKGQITADIAQLVACPSVDGPAAPGAPFGTQVREALDAALAIAERMGLATNDGEGYVGWAELPGDSGACIATVTHVDVVPEGNGWDADPFTLREREGWLLGRGTEDDKGPSILCLHALGFFKALGITPRYTLRALLGCNEEKGMGDIPYYLEKNPQPLFAFSPDAGFPLCNGEKGHFEADFVSPPFEGGHIVEFSGGHASNVIPDIAHCVVKTERQDLTAGEWVTPSIVGKGLVRLDARGIGGHAAHPAGTVNAIGRIVEYLLANDLGTEAETSFLALLYKLHCASDGSGLGIACRDEVFDPLTIIGGQVCMRGGSIVQNMDSRFPTAITGEGLAEALAGLAAQHGAAMEVASSVEPFYIPADSPPIQALLDAYRVGTGDVDAKPFTMGGGTYARCFQNAVSFGPGFPGGETPAFVGSMHGANEGANLDSLLKALKIYINALWKLQQLDY